MKKVFLKIAALGFIVAVLAVLPSCGKESDTTTVVGPSDATLSGYVFTMSIAPNVVNKGGSLTITVTVKTAAGAAVPSASVSYSGDVSAGTATAGANGIALANLSTTGSGGSTGYVTATVENKSLTVPFQIKP